MKCRAIISKRIGIAFLFTFVSIAVVYAKTTERVMPFHAGWFKPQRGTVNDTLRAFNLIPELIDTNVNFIPGRPGVKSANSIVALIINSEFALQQNTDFAITLRGYYETASPITNRLTKSPEFTLTVNYTRNGPYKLRDALIIPNAIYTRVYAVLEGVQITDSSDQRFRVEIRNEADLIFPPVVSQSPVMFSSKEDEVARHLTLNWSPVEWAEYYELEYLHVDDYKADGTRKERTELTYNFRYDAVRVRVHENTYELPLLFEQGYLLARVRAVGLTGRDFNVPVLGQWNLNESGNIPASGNHVFQINANRTHEGDRLNWQYVSTFNESGLRSEAVTYADGTSRTRQIVAASAADNKVLISETFYDHQGRAAISVLPAPVKPAASALRPQPAFSLTGNAGTSNSSGNSGVNVMPGLSNSILPGSRNLTGNVNLTNTLNTSNASSAFGLSPSILNFTNNSQLSGLGIPDFLALFRYRSQRARLGFVPRFNVNASGNPLLRNQYDRNENCDVTAPILGTQSGAGRYYSPANEEQAGWQAYVPDAEGYPYIQTKYTNDGTGRIREVTLPGPTHKSGSGKTKRFFYGTPAQQELDRYFGSDAGEASAYKKTLMLDENGQAYVSIHDASGNLVLSALTGDKPENLDAISGVERKQITIDAIDENNVLDITRNQWFSGKRLILPSRTTLQINYRTTSPQFAARYCTGANFCYDCVYDLEISITDACGINVFSTNKTLGKLNNINTCEAYEVNIDTILDLSPGSYFIAKSLTVNKEAAEAYIQNYADNFTCRKDVNLFLPDIEQNCRTQCRPCNTTTTSAVVRRRDGSNPSFTYRKRLPGNDSGCVLVCTENGLNECTAAYQNMLADVNPGGQYGEYRDTSSRSESNPLGVVNPSIYPLSVFSETNQLPLQNAHWRNPVYNYQTRTGADALVQVNIPGAPEHRATAGEIIRMDGKEYVLVKHLMHVEDFLRLWEAQWAEALVLFHPEYEYYMWCLLNQNSFRRDSLIVSASGYAQASSLGITDYRTDPLYISGSAALRAEWDNRITNYSSLSGSPVSAGQMAILSVHCANPNFTEAQLRDCYTSKTLFGTPGAENKEWEIYKGFYRRIKLQVLANERNRFITRAGGFNNRIIGGTRDIPANSLYAGKKRVFKEEDDVNDELQLTFEGEDPTVAELLELQVRYQRQKFRDCGICPLATDLITLFNALNYERKLTTGTLQLPGISPLTLSKNIVNSFSVPGALQYTWVRQTDSNPNILRIKILAGTNEVCNLTLQKSKTHLQWDSIVVFDCMRTTGDYSFTMRAIDNRDSTDIISGSSSCFQLNGCTFTRTCEPLPASRDMLTFLQYLFEGNRYRRLGLPITTNTSYTPFFTNTLKAQHPSGTTWVWNYGSISSRNMNGRLVISRGRGALDAASDNCNFTFSIITAGYTFDSISHIIAIRAPRSGLTGARYSNTAELQVRSRGGRIFYMLVESNCYPLYDCPTDNANTTASPERCCLPPPRRSTIENPCEEEMRLIALHEREREFETRKQQTVDSIRYAYIQHCLNSVREAYTLRYNDGLYMVTLYYHDRSGKLVRTVPPKGVKPLTDAQLSQCGNHRYGVSGTDAVYPAHTMFSAYRYTSLGLLASKTTPDEGTTRFSYDFAGRAIATQDAVQSGNNQIAYNLFDNNNRIIESGQANSTGTWATFRKYSDFISTLSGKGEITLIDYDSPSDVLSGEFPKGQQNLRNRVAAVRYQYNPGNNTYAAANSYDALGNVVRNVQFYASLGISRAQSIKSIDYVFDKLNGQVMRIVYQQGKADQFIHWYKYDINKRATEVQTATSIFTPEALRDKEAHFNYYQHGPVARMEIGQDKIQGIDYAYTIQGWLKGINSYQTGNADADMGHDGNETGRLAHGPFAKDVVSELVNYYVDDYKKIASERAAFYPPIAANLSNGFSKPLYNGFIQNSMMSIDYLFESDNRKTYAQSYSYDQFGRLTQSKNLFATSGDFTATYSNDFAMEVLYDLNGNITKLKRTGSGSTLIDDLTYVYNNSSKNQLHQILDGGVNGSADLRSQASNNYSYDTKGRLTADVSENIATIGYTHQNKVSSIEKAGNMIRYQYDAFGRRISKTSNGITEWYVNDASGNTMAMYRIEGGAVRWKEASILGGKRIGVYQPDIIISANSIQRDSVWRGKKSYEISNHIGDVLAVISDRKINSAEGLKAEVLAAHNYYPFGMAMPGRTSVSSTYRYGFQGMETEDDINGNNNAYTTEFRQYDPRVGRWMSVDPKAEKYPSWAPYVAFDNNPIRLVDPNGAQSVAPERDPAAEIAALGTVVDGFGNILLGAIELPGRAMGAVVDLASHTAQGWYSVVTGDYTDRGRESAEPRNALADLLINIFSRLPWCDVDRITDDERAQLRGILRGGIGQAIVEENLRRLDPTASDESVRGVAGVIMELGGAVVQGTGIPTVPTGIDGAIEDGVSAGSERAATVIAPTSVRQQVETIRGAFAPPDENHIENMIARERATQAIEHMDADLDASARTARPERATRVSRRDDGISAGERSRRDRQSREALRTPRRERAARSGATGGGRR